jgi:hypothetical protein
MIRGTLKVSRFVPILFETIRGRFELYRTPQNKKNKIKISHPNMAGNKMSMISSE